MSSAIAHVVQPARAVELADADVAVAAAATGPPRRTAMTRPADGTGTDRPSRGRAAVGAGARPRSSAAAAARSGRRTTSSHCSCQSALCTRWPEQPHEDAATVGQQRPQRSGCRARRRVDLRLLLLGGGPDAVAQLAQAAARQVPAAQQRRAAHPLQRDEVGPDRRAGQHRPVGLAHQRHMAGQPAFADVAQVGDVVAPLARDAVAVGPRPEPRAAQQRVVLGAERDADVERRCGAAIGAAPCRGRRSGSPASSARDVDARQRVGVAAKTRRSSAR